MMNMALYKREMKGSIKLLIIFAAVITLYVSVIISMYDPELMKTLDSFTEAMPELMGVFRTVPWFSPSRSCWRSGGRWR